MPRNTLWVCWIHVLQVITDPKLTEPQPAPWLAAPIATTDWLFSCFLLLVDRALTNIVFWKTHGC